MHVIKRKTLQEFWEKYPLSEQPLTAWYNEAIHSTWNTPNDIKEKYGSADILPDNRIVFNIGGNKYRLIVKIAYKIQQVYIRFVGTHSEYDKINAGTI
ncbi:MAG: type II toxin-antitoxin system HigB family toxin [Lentisphaeria bacterium]|nr:type II toxin-antitoxin system HigB family toxin [Lentisphaeria bacterium]